jgi:patatin-like phospholipase/acyl hydrolase
VSLVPLPASRFQILALDGGGFKGIFAAAVLAAIEEDLGGPVVDHFDLVAGTSTGGIIALALGAGLRPQQIVDFYAEFGPDIFRKSAFRPWLGWTAPKYSAQPLRNALERVLGDRRLGDSTIRLVIPCFDLDRDRVHIFKTPHHERLRRDWRHPMADVAVATAAAPTYFPTASIDSLRLIDGGVWANNPVVLGIAEAVSLCGVRLEDVHAFSIGTTTDLTRRKPSLDRGGKLHWMPASIDVVLRGQSIGADGLAQHLLTNDRYLRLDPFVPEKVLAMDRVDTRTLMGLARGASRELMPNFKRMFGNHFAPNYQPIQTVAGAAS